VREAPAMLRIHPFLAGVVLAALLPLAAGAQTEAPFIPPTHPKTAVTKHTMTLDGKALAYTATAGVIQLPTPSGAAGVNIFYTYYKLDDAGPNRPVTFIYNGGPGSSSMWLHMGAFGPKRVVTLNAETTPPAPYRMADNDGTLLDRTDMVFIDAPGTGFSNLVGRDTGKYFFGVDEDAEAFDTFIKSWLTKYDRWNAPKYLLGESYGTTRSANLINRLQNDDVTFRGVILISSVLDFSTFDRSQDISYIGFFPSLAATAWYHHQVPNAPASIEAFVAKARQFAAGEYAQALMQGANLPEARRREIAQTMHDFIGLDPAYILDANLRVGPDRFEKELLRAQRKTIGRLDGRYTGIDRDAAGESPSYDPSDTAVSGAFVALFNRYVRDDLKFTDDQEYKGTNYGVVLRTWNYRRSARGTSATNVADDLRQAMTTNPYLRVFSANGYYDLATPFFATEYTLSHLSLEPALQKHISYGFYQSGHMIYMNPDARRALRHDLEAFYDSTR
jgi:carboxypeptidase C (cathepsin A)